MQRIDDRTVQNYDRDSEVGGGVRMLDYFADIVYGTTICAEQRPRFAAAAYDWQAKLFCWHKD